MVIFQVLRNGEVIQQLPLSPNTFLHAGVFWHDHPTREKAENQLRLTSAGGDYGETDNTSLLERRQWDGVTLQVGDEVTIRILESADDEIVLTPPDCVVTLDKVEHVLVEREHYEQLKARFEGAGGGGGS